MVSVSIFSCSAQRAGRQRFTPSQKHCGTQNNWRQTIWPATYSVSDPLAFSLKLSVDQQTYVLAMFLQILKHCDSCAFWQNSCGFLFCLKNFICTMNIFQQIIFVTGLNISCCQVSGIERLSIKENIRLETGGHIEQLQCVF